MTTENDSKRLNEKEASRLLKEHGFSPRVTDAEIDQLIADGRRREANRWVPEHYKKLGVLAERQRAEEAAAEAAEQQRRADFEERMTPKPMDPSAIRGNTLVIPPGKDTASDPTRIEIDYNKQRITVYQEDGSPRYVGMNGIEKLDFSNLTTARIQYRGTAANADGSDRNFKFTNVGRLQEGKIKFLGFDPKEGHNIIMGDDSDKEKQFVYTAAMKGANQTQFADRKQAFDEEQMLARQERNMHERWEEADIRHAAHRGSKLRQFHRMNALNDPHFQGEAAKQGFQRGFGRQQYHMDNDAYRLERERYFEQNRSFQMRGGYGNGFGNNGNGNNNSNFGANSYTPASYQQLGAYQVSDSSEVPWYKTQKDEARVVAARQASPDAPANFIEALISMVQNWLNGGQATGLDNKLQYAAANNGPQAPTTVAAVQPTTTQEQSRS